MMLSKNFNNFFMISKVQDQHTSKKSAHQIELRSKKTYLKIQCRPYQQKLAMSGLIFKHSFLLEHLVYYDPYQYVELSNCKDAYNQLKGVTCVWLGECIPRGTNLSQRTMLAKTLQELKQMTKKLREDQKLILFYIQKSVSHLNLKELDEMKQIIKVPIQNYDNINKAVEISQKNTNGQLESFFPNFCLLSSDNKAEINKIKYNLYWMLAWQNFHKSRDDFLKFAEFYYSRESNKKKAKNELDQLFKQYKSVFRNTKREIKLYTSDTDFHKILNNCLRVFQSPYDFAHIRFPFRHMFLTIVQLFIQQGGSQFRQKGFTCYRGCYLSEQQVKQLKDYQNKYIHVNGFVSASQKLDIAKKFGKYTIIIDVPPVSKNSSFFHCFAQVKNQSQFYSQFEFIFNPLNVFKVVKVSQKDKEIRLQYINVEKIPRKSDQLSEIDRSLVENYDFQRNMVSLNRNQGQYLWKQWDHGAEKFYKSKITYLLKLASEKIQPEYSMRKLSKAEQFFYKKIQQFATDFKWSDKEENNLKIVDEFLDKFEYKASELHFHIGRYLQNQLDFLTSFIFLAISYSVTSRRFSKHSSFNYTIYTNVGIALAYLDQFRSAQKIFDIARVNFQSNLSNLIIYQSNYPFIIFVAVTFYQMGKAQKYKEVKQFMKNVIKATQKPQKIQNNHWLCLLDNLNQISQVQKFRSYFKVTFGRTNPYLKKMYVFCIQNVLQQVHEAELEDLTKERAQKLFSNLCDCSKILKAHDINGDLQHDLVRMLLYLCNCHIRKLNLLWSFSPYAIDTVTNQFEDYLEDTTIKSFSYYKLKVYFAIVKYSLRAKLQYPKLKLLKHFLFLQTILRKNYRKCYYLHYSLLTVLLQYYIRQGLLGSAAEVVRMIKIVKSKIDVMLVLDKQELRTMLMKMKKKGMQNNVKSEKAVTCWMGSQQKSS